MFAVRRETPTDVEARERFVRVVGLPELDDGVGPPEIDDPARPGASSDGARPSGLSDGAPPSRLSGGGAGLSGGGAGLSGGGGAAPLVGLPGLLGAFDPGRRGVRALVLVALIGVVVAAGLAWRSRPQVDTLPASSPASTGSLPLPQPAPADASAGQAGTVVVAVTGRVSHPGLVRLPTGARVADAIEAAGGVTAGTDLSFVNLARKLVDGELVAVGVTPPPGVATGPDGTAAVPAPGGGPAGLVNLNTATASQLEALPGIGPVLAQHIVDYRNRHGQFRSVDELRQVDGVGAARFAQLKPLVTR
ncbi:MAG: competence protein ComEA [Micromonosporaceae bacterium]|nr:competence protein ComEA [Micromonosporaceae bacterium]